MRPRLRKIKAIAARDVVTPLWALVLIMMMLLVNAAIWGKEMFGV